MVLRAFSDFFFPRYCCMCECRLALAEDEICAKCLRTLNRIEYEGGEVHGVIERLFWGRVPIVRATSMFQYEGEQTRRILHNIKYFDRPEAAVVLAGVFAREQADTDFFDGVDMIIPLPLAKKKQRKRGYNQCDYIARGLSLQTGIPIANNVAIRAVNNPTQTHLDHEQRKENVKGIFQLVNPQKITDRHVLIVDDVITTGSTLLSFAEEIAKAPGVSISVFSLAFAGQMVKAGLP
mgnify:FL=1